MLKRSPRFAAAAGPAGLSGSAAARSLLRVPQEAPSRIAISASLEAVEHAFGAHPFTLRETARAAISRARRMRQLTMRAIAARFSLFS
jgi:hypothetical protein